MSATPFVTANRFMTQSHCLEHNSSIASSSDPNEQTSDFLNDVLTGLSQPNKELHCKYFYDELGSQLFDQICELPEYYPTRTESSIMRADADAICQHIGEGAVLVEYGSGSSTKTRQLLDHLVDQQAYLPVDISDEHLLRTADQLRLDYPELKITPIVADFTVGFDIPAAYRDTPITVYFPGSTIGNLPPDAAVKLLTEIAKQCQLGGGLLIGFDLDKSPEKLIAAYDDSTGVTAKFNLNLLNRINRELDGNFDMENFSHVAIYNEEHTRIEIYIESCIEQTVAIGEIEIKFAEGERIFTEYSHKYSIDQFQAMAGRAGFAADAVWTDDNELFAVMHLSVK
ncbi:L-histidine N(alpha)-methyltransferase [bacterium]|nr:L-histidine N(alpha)-methyltransferase [bacterium]